jgi:hypothetical protein
MSKYNEMFNEHFNYIYNNQYILGLLVLCTVIYFIILRNKVPKYIDNILQNNLFVFLVLSFSLYKLNGNVNMAIMVSLCYLLVVTLLRKSIILS